MTGDDRRALIDAESRMSDDQGVSRAFQPRPTTTEDEGDENDR